MIAYALKENYYTANEKRILDIVGCVLNWNSIVNYLWFVVEKIFIVAMFAFGYCETFKKGNVFEAVGNWAESNLPEKLWKPLGGCCVCCAFWVGTLMYWIFWGDYWVHWLMISVASVGVNAAITTIINKIEDISNPPQ